MRRTASALCLCLALCSLPTISEAVPPIPGDIDLDGDVDFTDFLIFVLNYGKVGPVPTVEYGRVDTVYVPLELPPAVYRAVELLGFWTFNNFDFVMGDIEAEPGNDGEYFVLGTSSSGVLVGGKYSPLVGQYFLTYLGPVWDYSFSFDIYETGQVVGEILRSPANNGILESYSPLVSGWPRHWKQLEKLRFKIRINNYGQHRRKGAHGKTPQSRGIHHSSTGNTLTDRPPHGQLPSRHVPRPR